MKIRVEGGGRIEPKDSSVMQVVIAGCEPRAGQTGFRGAGKPVSPLMIEDKSCSARSCCWRAGRANMMCLGACARCDAIAAEEAFERITLSSDKKCLHGLHARTRFLTFNVSQTRERHQGT